MTAAPYELKSELARWSLDSRRGQPDRRLAWVNSICALFLLVGVVGARTHPPPPRTPAPLEEAVPIVAEPLPPPPAAEKTPAPERPQQQAAAPIIVVPNSPAVNFSVPTVGSLVAPISLAQAPPAEAQLRETEAPPLRSTFLQNTGGGGDRPGPSDDDYPVMAKKFGQQGTVALQMTADADGGIATLEITRSSGSSILDRFTKNWVLSRWKLPRNQAGRIFEAQFNYVLMR